MALLQIVQWNEKSTAAHVLAWRWTTPGTQLTSWGTDSAFDVQETREAILFRDGALDLSVLTLHALHRERPHPAAPSTCPREARALQGVGVVHQQGERAG